MCILKKTLKKIIDDVGNCGLNLYLLIDATWEERLAETIRMHSKGWEPLIGTYGENKEAAHMRAPLIVDLQKHPIALDEWLIEGFPVKLGIIIASKLPIEGLRTSLKRFTLLITPEFQKPAYFRFYDARVLYCFLMTGFLQQWADFFNDIEFIVAPSDLTPLWTTYRFANEKMIIGIQDASNETFSFKLALPQFDDEVYKANWPFRRLNQRQYDAILTCSNQNFLNEIYDFLAKAFPDDQRIKDKSLLITKIRQWLSIAQSENYHSNDCLMYWAVLSFLGGDNFHKQNNTLHYLQIEWMSQENKLETLIESTNKYIENNHLVDLIDVYEITEEDENGNSICYKERSGRIIAETLL